MDQFKAVAVDDHLLDASDGEEDNLSSDELIMDAAEEQQLLQDENGQAAAAAREQGEEESEECDTLDLGINDQERFPDDEEDEDDRLSDPGLLSADYDETTPRTEKQHNAKSTPPPPRGSPFSRLGSRPNDRGRRGGDFRPRGGNRGSSRAGLRGAVSNRGFFRPSDLPEESIMMSSSRYKHHPFRSSPRLPPPTLVPSSTPSAVFTNIQQQRPSIGGAATTGSHHSLPVQSTFLPTNDLRNSIRPRGPLPLSLARASRHEHATHPSDSIPVDPFGPPKTGLKAYQRFDDIVEEPEEEEQVDKESVGGLEIDLGRESPLESTDRKDFIPEVIASDDDDDVVIIEEEEVDVKPSLAEAEANFAYHDVDDEEVQFLEEKPFEDEIMRPPTIIPVERARQRNMEPVPDRKPKLETLGDVKPRVLPATSDSDIETIYLDSDDDNGEADDTSFCGTPAATTEAEEEDFDDDVIAYNYSNQIHCPEKKDAVVDATPTRLSERIQTQNKTSFESVVTKPPAIQPQLMRGDISQPRFKRALEKRRRDPDRFVNNLIKKRRREEGRCEVTMRNIPENWDDLKVQNVLKAYGELKGFGFNPQARCAVAKFKSEQDAEECVFGLLQERLDKANLFVKRDFPRDRPARILDT